MHRFKRIIYIINKTIGFFGLGCGIGRILDKDFKLASFILLIVSILFAIDHLLDSYRRIKEDF